ncbi:maleylpyruvate isomerase family mycothiol-dependent enzyme [Nocardioides sp. SOB77]|uniref:Maleylpyruvate isomerase family mycothiol-dependent enzyme n=1 Tax=Nocardioides oceani TaxID=3058369 RepID=A0ABT8FHR6_9ACTN|nr:maleylpyruvate isomerase family mycothiol-dependent enzyme [Nocardioides oceani]MDN4174101.1 maleylpyruvate isomerase family mycothiol-dependent enzyme [Nocardioides oceani]
MDIFEEIADERRTLAALVSGLTPEEEATRSLCTAWSVREVVAHLVVPLEVGLAGFAVAMVLTGGRFDRANVHLARRHARRSTKELVAVLRQRADSRFTPPGMGPEAPLTDLLVHGMDIRWPLGLHRDVPAERVRTSLDFLTSAAGRGLVPRGTSDGLRFEADDVGWAHGGGPTVRGAADAVLLALAGRPAALDHLAGDGVPTLRDRLSAARR